MACALLENISQIVHTQEGWWWIIPFVENNVDARRSSASAMALPTHSRLGFLRAEIASFSSASTFAFFATLGSCRSAMLLLLTSEFLRDKLESLSSLLALNFDSNDESLSSLLIPDGTAIEAAGRMRAKALLGPRDMLRRCS